MHVPPRAAVKPQCAAGLLCGHGHAQQPPAGVQKLARAAAVGKDPARQRREAHHLRVSRQAVARGRAKLALGLVAVLLGDEKDRPALAGGDAGGYFVKNTAGLAGAGTAQYQSNHDLIIS